MSVKYALRFFLMRNARGFETPGLNLRDRAAIGGDGGLELFRQRLDLRRGDVLSH